MSQTTLNLVAITLFTLVMSSLLGPLLHISPFIPAAATIGILGIATLDTFNWQGKAGTLLVGWVDSFSPEHRMRVLQHEAGHFLVAHLLDIPVTGYSLSAWEAFRQGQSGRGGVSFALPDLAVELQGKSSQLVDRLCMVWMAGIAAETLAYGKAEGGGDDRQQLRLLWSQLQRPDSEGALKERWAILQAKTLLEEQRPAYEALVLAMSQRQPVETCCLAIDQSKSAV
ncbi:MAG: ATP-dependent Zn protease [Pegethrix bostrychoides GSE-TBD4-15B]|uniref:ATP-dependent Zn protease n=1 Tax=Pegethrix bostrychoides GSE-TBD4-15B TaxID=2839662 RepID=A0A951P6D7_9CYAN|nr:ATP-dependent Zn protease [Pegethrix bostrychoides GSE-TBD4-15B]